MLCGMKFFNKINYHITTSRCDRTVEKVHFNRKVHKVLAESAKSPFPDSYRNY